MMRVSEADLNSRKVIASVATFPTVSDRVHRMKLDLAGKIKNTPLPRSKALWPMFEAVVNSFQAIEDAGDRVRKPVVEIEATRDSSLPGLEADTEVNSFTITDNGVGFD